MRAEENQGERSSRCAQQAGGGGSLQRIFFMSNHLKNHYGAAQGPLGQTWCVSILPFIEQRPLYDAINKKTGMGRQPYNGQEGGGAQQARTKTNTHSESSVAVVGERARRAEPGTEITSVY